MSVGPCLAKSHDLAVRAQDSVTTYPTVRGTAAGSTDPVVSRAITMAKGAKTTAGTAAELGTTAKQLDL